MKPSSEIRRENLNLLIEQHGSIANLNTSLGRKRTDATLSQLRKGLTHSGSNKVRVMGDTLARDIEKRLSLGLGWMDTDHTGVIIPDIEGNKQDGVWVPELENYETMGDEISLYEQDVIVGGVTLAPEFVRRLNASHPSNLRVVNGHGDSMLPTIHPGDKILVDEGVKDLYDGIYVLQSYDSVFIKRVSKNLKGKLLISSDNPNVKLSEELDGSEELKVIGRVVYVWHGFFV